MYIHRGMTAEDQDLHGTRRDVPAYIRTRTYTYAQQRIEAEEKDMARAEERIQDIQQSQERRTQTHSHVSVYLFMCVYRRVYAYRDESMYTGSQSHVFACTFVLCIKFLIIRSAASVHVYTA
jgi:hypothetical protein